MKRTVENFTLLLPCPRLPKKCTWEVEWEHICYSECWSHSLSEWQHNYHRTDASYLPVSLRNWTRIVSNGNPSKQAANKMERIADKVFDPNPQRQKEEREAWRVYAKRLREHGYRNADSDIGGFALYSTLSEAELLRILSHESHNAKAKQLVTRFYDFAVARWMYHCEIYKRLYAGQTGVKDSKEDLAKNLREKTRRYKRLKNWQDPNLDLWLILIWPIVTRWKWNYADVERARRMKFYEMPKRVKTFLTDEVVKTWLDYVDKKGKRPPFPKFASEDEYEWNAQKMSITRGALDAVKSRCKRLDLSLAKLPRRSKKEFPPMLNFVLRVTAN